MLRKFFIRYLNSLTGLALYIYINTASAEITILHGDSDLCLNAKLTIEKLSTNIGSIDFSSLKESETRNFTKLRLDSEYTTGASFDRNVKVFDFDIDNDGIKERILRTDEQVVKNLYRIELYAIEYSQTFSNSLTMYLEDSGWLPGIGLNIPRIYNLPLSLPDTLLPEFKGIEVNHALPSLIHYSGRNYLILEEIGRFNRFIFFTEVKKAKSSFEPQIKCLFKK